MCVLPAQIEISGRHRAKLTYTSGGDEHGIVSPYGSIAVGDLVLLLPGVCARTRTPSSPRWLHSQRRTRVQAIVIRL